MSIVALKRNSKRFQTPVSSNGFSLNGGHRNQRPIANTNLSSLMNGKNNICSGNDASIVKLSTKSNRGHISSRIKYPVCDNGACGLNGSGLSNWVKNFSPEDNSQGEHIKNLIQATSATCQKQLKTNSGEDTLCLTDCKVRSYFIGGRKVYTMFNAKNSGSPYTQGAMTASDYLKTGLLLKNCLPTPASKAPFPPSLLHGGCNVNALNPEDAVANGLLPNNWTG